MVLIGLSQPALTLGSAMQEEDLKKQERADPQRRLIAAARQLFFAAGYSGVSTEQLARRAGVSKSTLYKYFGDMHGVLRAVAESEADHFEFDMSRAPPTAPEFEAALVAFGSELLQLILQEDKLKFDRLMFEQARSSPDIAEIYYTSAIERTQEHLEELLEYGRNNGFLKDDVNIRNLSDHLLSMWQGLASVRLRLGLRLGSPLDFDGWSRSCVETLLSSQRHPSA